VVKFKKVVVMKRKIIGYKLVEEDYYEAALELLRLKSVGLRFTFRGVEGFMGFSRDGFNLEVGVYGSLLFDVFKKAGVLDFWFEPIHEDDEVRGVLLAFCKHYELEFSTLEQNNEVGVFYRRHPIEDAVDKFLNLKK